MNARATSLAACAALALAACSSVQWVPRPDPEAGPPAPGNARVRVARPGAFYLSGVSIGVLDADEPVGVLRTDGNLCWERPAGPALISLGGPGYDQMTATWSRWLSADLELDLEPGRTVTLVATPLKSPEVERRREAEGDAVVAWSNGFDAWELRLVDGAEADAVFAATDAAKVKPRPADEVPERYEGPGIAFPVPPVGERVAESPQDRGVAFVNRFGHALILEWIPWPGGGLPRDAVALEAMLAERLVERGEPALHTEPVPGELPQAFLVSLVSEGATFRVSGGLFGDSHAPDATRGTLATVYGDVLYLASWQWGAVPPAEDVPEQEVWNDMRNRLLDFLETVEFSPVEPDEPVEG